MEIWGDSQETYSFRDTWGYSLVTQEEKINWEMGSRMEDISPRKMEQAAEEQSVISLLLERIRNSVLNSGKKYPSEAVQAQLKSIHLG